MRSEREPGRGIGRPVGAPRILHPREEQARVGLQRGGHGGDRAWRKRAAHRFDPGIRERDFVRSRQRGGAKRGRDLLGVEQPVGAVFVIGAGQQHAEFLENPALGGIVEIEVAP